MTDTDSHDPRPPGEIGGDGDLRTHQPESGGHRQPDQAEANGHLRTDQAEANLRTRAVRGGLATMGVQAFQFSLGLASTAILARLLMPSDFGLIAMAATLTNLLLPFADVGLSALTVQIRSLTETQATTLFWINVGLGLAITALLIGLAPGVAWFYEEPELVAPTVALALAFAVGGLGVQHSALLRRQMRFESLAVVQVCSLTMGVAAGVAGALAGAGYWALVFMSLAQQVAYVTGAWLVSGWRPGFSFRYDSIRPMLSFGAGLTGFRVLTYLANNADNVVIGRVVGTTALGLYSKAYSLLLLPVRRVRGPAAEVVVPALSRLQDDTARFRDYYLKAITLVTAVGMPLVASLFVFAQEAVLLVLGPQWQESVPLFQALAPAAFLGTFNVAGSWACMPFGRTGRLFRWQVLATSGLVVAFLIGARWGALGVAIGLSVATVVLRVPAVVYLLRGSPVRPLDLLAAITRPACASLIAGAVVFALRDTLASGFGPAVTLAAGFASFSVLYALVWIVPPGGRAVIGDFRPLLDDLWPGGDR